MYAGGGGGSNPMCAQNSGGTGGAGFYNKPITQPFSQPYSVGAGGNSAPSNANAGGSTTIANVGTVNGGGAAGGSPGANGNQPGSNLTIVNAFRPGGYGRAGSQSSVLSAGTGATCSGQTGGTGLLVVFENSGT
jgi:hypothetical protein